MPSAPNFLPSQQKVKKKISSAVLATRAKRAVNPCLNNYDPLSRVIDL